MLSRLPAVTKALLIANVLIFVLQRLSESPVFDAFARTGVAGVQVAFVDNFQTVWREGLAQFLFGNKSSVH